METIANKYIFNKEKNKNIDFIGEGGFGACYRAKIINTNEKRAIKIIDKNKIKESFKRDKFTEPTDEDLKPYYDDLLKEINFMKKMEEGNNENTVKFYEHFDYNDKFYIIMELCDMNLLDYFSKRGVFNPNEIKEMLIQLNNSFKIMQKYKIAHRDLSLDNILIKYQNDQSIIYKLTDYGVSKQLSTLYKKFSTKIGKLNYMAPEVLNVNNNDENNQEKEKDGFDNKCDLWSLGIMIYILLFKRFPYSGNTEVAIKNHISNLKITTKTDDNKLNDLIIKLLEKDPKKRLNWNDYFNHPFLENDNIIKIKIKVEENDKEGNEFNNIYFLDNTPYMKSLVGFYKENEEITNLNENNAELYINGKKKEFKKYFKPDTKGEYIIKIIFKIKMKDCSFMFSGCNNIKSIDLTLFDSSNVTNMSYMFSRCHYIEEINLDKIKTDNVVDMSYMFNKCINLKQIKFSPSINTKNIQNMQCMFQSCHNLCEIYFDNFQTNNVVNMRGLFSECYNLKNLNLNSFNTSKVENMSYMFNQCTSLEKIKFNPETFVSLQTTNMCYMFHNCNNLKKIDLSSFNTKKVNYLDDMFLYCENLMDIDISNFIINGNASLTNMFEGCSKLKKLNLSSFIIGDNNKIDNMFNEMKQIKEIKVNQNSIETLKKKFYNIESIFRIN